MTTQAHQSFCRAPLHPGPCKGWKATGAAKKAAPVAKSAPAKKAAPAKPKSPAQAVRQNTDIGKPSKTGKANKPLSGEQMEADWKAHNASLTDDQRKAANLYSTGAHHAMNTYMRTPPGQEPAAHSNKGVLKDVDLGKQVGLLQDAMAPAPKGTLVYRGMGFRSVGLGEDPDEDEIMALVGQKLVNDGFTSTSVSRQQAFEGFERGIELELEVPEGTPSLWLDGNSNLPWEQELLLASGGKMEIIGITTRPSDDETEFGVIYQMKARMVP